MRINTKFHAPVAQHFDSLLAAPPLAIVEISRIFIREQALAALTRYLNQTLESVKRLVDVSPSGVSPSDSGDLQDKFSTHSFNSLHTRDNLGQCDPENPCPDGSCCNISGGCGYGSENCGSGNCSSNCMHLRPAGISKLKR